MMKNIAITEYAYKLLVKSKLRGESFSEVILSHFKKKKTLFDYAGVWADIPDEGWREFEQKISDKEHQRF